MKSRVAVPERPELGTHTSVGAWRPVVWLLRAAMAAAASYAARHGDIPGASLTLGLLVLACAPLLVARLRHRATPGLIEFGVVLALSVPGLSTGLGLYDHVLHWGKLVHTSVGLLVTMVIASLVLGYRDVERIDLTDELAGVLAMLAGVMFGVCWELVEFIVDWVLGSDLQKSNVDTMTDLLWSDLAVVVGALLMVRLYCHALAASERREHGALAAWLVAGPSRLLDRHGFAITIVAALIIGAAVAAMWFTGRALPIFGAA